MPYNIIQNQLPFFYIFFSSRNIALQSWKKICSENCSYLAIYLKLTRLLKMRHKHALFYLAMYLKPHSSRWDTSMQCSIFRYIWSLYQSSRWDTNMQRSSLYHRPSSRLCLYVGLTYRSTFCESNCPSYSEKLSEHQAIWRKTLNNQIQRPLI